MWVSFSRCLLPQEPCWVGGVGENSHIRSFATVSRATRFGDGSLPQSQYQLLCFFQPLGKVQILFCGLRCPGCCCAFLKGRTILYRAPGGLMQSRAFCAGSRSSCGMPVSFLRCTPRALCSGSPAFDLSFSYGDHFLLD